MFQKRTEKTEKIVAKNWRKDKKETHDQTWDKMILIEESTGTVGLVDYDKAMWHNNDATLDVRFNIYDIEMIAKEVKPCSVLSKVNFDEIMNEAIQKVFQIPSKKKFILRKSA